VTPSLPALVPALVNWSHEHSNHFKVKIRHLLERMIRKYGYDAIERYVPEDDKKLVSSIRKRQNRLKKKKAAAAEMDVDRDLDDDEVRRRFECFPFRCESPLHNADHPPNRPRDRKLASNRRTTRSCTARIRTSLPTRTQKRQNRHLRASRTASRRHARTNGTRMAAPLSRRAKTRCLTCSTTA
jgi:hypothetical protein